MRTSKKPARYDLDKVYYFTQYNKTQGYGKSNINVSGVSEQLRLLDVEKAGYKSDIAGIIGPVREREASLFAQWETRYMKKARWFNVGKIIGLITIIDIIFDNNLPLIIRKYFSPLLLLAIIVIIPVMLLMTASERLARKKYNDFIAPIAEQINRRGADFEEKARVYYRSIDNLYLASLDPAMREVILLRREQEEHNKEMARIERERLGNEKEALTEARKTRQAQERLVAIEEARDRERHSRGW